MVMGTGEFQSAIIQEKFTFVLPINYYTVDW
uniref:Uncharacterized protein n=1 Tax=Triticum urartu TaxID=4572 RepID=A0A8R7TYZ2_TRIUA